MYHPIATAMFQIFIGGGALIIVVGIILEEVRWKRKK